jgi:hypothetical protein
MRPVQSRFTTPLTSFFPAPKLVMTVSGLAISHSFSVREAERRHLDRAVALTRGSLANGIDQKRNLSGMCLYFMGASRRAIV